MELDFANFTYEDGTRVLVDDKPYILCLSEADPVEGAIIYIAYTPEEWEAEAHAYEVLVIRESDGLAFLNRDDQTLFGFDSWHPSNAVTVHLAPILIEEVNSTYIQAEAKRLGITEATLIAEGGDGENHITVWELTGPDGSTFRVANTNAEPVWEEQDPAVFAELLESVGIDA